MSLTGPEEVWLKTVRGQDKRGVPLARRRTTNRLALEQTAKLQRYRTQSQFSLQEKREVAGSRKCEGCGKPLPRSLKRCKEKRAVWERGGPVVRYYLGPCCL